MKPPQFTLATALCAASGALLLALSAISLAQAPRGEKPLPSAEELRRKLDSMEAQRANREPEAELPWRASGPAAFPNGTSARNAQIELKHDASTLSCVWTFRSFDDAARPPLRACLDSRGSETIVLPPGDYEISLRVGKADEGSLTFPKMRVRMRAGQGYQSDFDRKAESRMKKRLAAALKQSGGPKDAPSEVQPKDRRRAAPADEGKNPKPPASPELDP